MTTGPVHPRRSLGQYVRVLDRPWTGNDGGLETAPIRLVPLTTVVLISVLVSEGWKLKEEQEMNSLDWKKSLLLWAGKTTDSFGSVESVKAASDVYAPANGEVVEINEALSETPGILNEDPEGAGWFMKMKITGTAPDTLMDSAAYDDHCKKQG